MKHRERTFEPKSHDDVDDKAGDDGGEAGEAIVTSAESKWGSNIQLAMKASSPMPNRMKPMITSLRSKITPNKLPMIKCDTTRDQYGETDKSEREFAVVETRHDETES